MASKTDDKTDDKTDEQQVRWLPAPSVKRAEIMIEPGMFEERTVYGVKVRQPSRFQYAEPDDDDDRTGWIWLDGKRTSVETGYWGGVLIWELSDDDR